MTKPTIHSFYPFTEKSNEKFLIIKLTNPHKDKDPSLDVYKLTVNKLKENKFFDRKNFSEHLKSKN